MYFLLHSTFVFLVWLMAEMIFQSFNIYSTLMSNNKYLLQTPWQGNVMLETKERKLRFDCFIEVRLEIAFIFTSLIYLYHLHFTETAA